MNNIKQLVIVCLIIQNYLNFILFKLYFNFSLKLIFIFE